MFICSIKPQNKNIKNYIECDFKDTKKEKKKRQWLNSKINLVISVVHRIMSDFLNLQQHFTDFLQWADVYFVIVNNKH